jgi:hypothetical protein
VIADVCAPPGPTKITGANINQATKTASFQYFAKHALHYQCELLVDKSVKSRGQCGAMKKYTTPLSPGKYVFVVWGVNNGGGSARPATKQFTIR